MMQPVNLFVTLGQNVPTASALPEAPAAAAPAAPAAPVRTENIGAQGIPGATTTTTAAPGTMPVASGAQPLPSASPASSSASLIMLLPVVLLVVLLLTSWQANRKEKAKRAELMASLSTHDKVQTSGGIIGTIAELRDDEVVLRVDESSNTRIRFSRAAIVAVLDKGRRGGNASSQTEGKPNGAGSKATA